MTKPRSGDVLDADRNCDTFFGSRLSHMRIKNGRDGCVCTVVSGWVARMKCEWVGNHNDVLSTGIT